MPRFTGKVLLELPDAPSRAVPAGASRRRLINVPSHHRPAGRSRVDSGSCLRRRLRRDPGDRRAERARAARHQGRAARSGPGRERAPDRRHRRRVRGGAAVARLRDHPAADPVLGRGAGLVGREPGVAGGDRAGHSPDRLHRRPGAGDRAPQLRSARYRSPRRDSPAVSRLPAPPRRRGIEPPPSQAATSSDWLRSP